jgi:hypothetical protein
MYPAQNAERSINISGITQNIGQRGGSYGYFRWLNEPHALYRWHSL